jgi:hypothetical protein
MNIDPSLMGYFVIDQSFDRPFDKLRALLRTGSGSNIS